MAFSPHRLSGDTGYFALTLLIAAALVFTVQPMAGKMLLPLTGGSAAGWAVAMAFFQTSLLAGYLLSHLLSRLPPLLHAGLVICCLAGGLLTLPVDFQSGLVSESNLGTASNVYWALLRNLGLPFTFLAATAPSFMRLFSYTRNPRAHDPYFLYAASNIGSFAGLLSYPFLIEPFFMLKTQNAGWTAFYTLLIGLLVLAVFLAFMFHRRGPAQTSETESRNIPETDWGTWRTRLQLLMLAAIPSSLILGTTTEITTDMIAMPLFWVLPLALYLLSHILAFSERFDWDHEKLSLYHVIAVTLILFPEIFGSSLIHGGLLFLPYILLVLAGFFITALTLHIRLASLRPHKSRLTAFFLYMALGGALGGIFNAFVAPLIFNDTYEFEAALLLSLPFTALWFQKTAGASRKTLGFFVLANTLLLAGFVSQIFIPDPETLTAGVLKALLMASLIATALFHLRIFAVFLLALFLSGIIATHQTTLQYKERSFFGVSEIHDMQASDEESSKVRYYLHGTTMHGLQPLSGAHKYRPSSYYSDAGPVGQVFKSQEPENVAVIGLGAGQLACYNAPGRKFTFFEIDPVVARIAKTWFSYLDHCGYHDIILGDGRISLQRQENESYDLIVIDAFSSDFVPVHLLTREAFSLYFERLDEDGLILINVANRYLDLGKPVARIAETLQAKIWRQLYKPAKDRPLDVSSDWVVLTRDPAWQERIAKWNWSPLEKNNSRIWTDQYTSLLPHLDFIGLRYASLMKSKTSPY